MLSCERPSGLPVHGVTAIYRIAPVHRVTAIYRITPVYRIAPVHRITAIYGIAAITALVVRTLVAHLAHPQMFRQLSPT